MNVLVKGNNHIPSWCIFRLNKPNTSHLFNKKKVSISLTFLWIHSNVKVIFFNFTVHNSLNGVFICSLYHDISTSLSLLHISCLICPRMAFSLFFFFFKAVLHLWLMGIQQIWVSVFSCLKSMAPSSSQSPLYWSLNTCLYTSCCSTLFHV